MSFKMGFDILRNYVWTEMHYITIKRLKKKKVHLRGAPSAISMAVIPRDQISLWNINKRPRHSP